MARSTRLLLLSALTLGIPSIAFPQDKARDDETREGSPLNDGSSGATGASKRPAPTPAHVGWFSMPYMYRGPYAGGSLQNLLLSPEVQQELGLQERQIEEIKNGEFMEYYMLREEMAPRLGSLERSGDEAGYVQATAELNKIEAKLQEVTTDLLTRPQLKRLRQIALQQAGPFAVLHPDVVARLYLSPDQISLMKLRVEEQDAQRKVEREQRLAPPVRVSAPSGEELSPDEARTLSEFWKRARAGDEINQRYEQRAVDELMKVLRPRQRERLSNLLGDPFDLSKLTTNYNFRDREKPEGHDNASPQDGADRTPSDQTEEGSTIDPAADDHDRVGNRTRCVSYPDSI